MSVESFIGAKFSGSWDYNLRIPKDLSSGLWREKAQSEYVESA